MDFLNKNKIPYLIELTNNTMVIKVEQLNKKYIVSDAGLKLTELGFIRMVKSRAEKNNRLFPKVKRNEIDYYRFKDLKAGHYKDIVEIDLNKAYWEIAYRESIIDLETYKKGKGKNVSKRSRLVALGSLATIKTIFEFDGERHELIEIKASEHTRNYFFHVSKKVDYIMKNVKASIPEEQFYFFWVDAFFISKKAALKVGMEIKKFNLDYKTNEIKWMKVKDVHDGKLITVLELTKTVENSHSEFKIKPFKITDHKRKKKDDIQHFNKTVLDMHQKISRGLFLK